MEIRIVNLKNFALNFCTSLEKAEHAADAFYEILKRLNSLKDNCAGMDAWVGSTRYTVKREGGVFYFLENMIARVEHIEEMEEIKK